MSIRLLTVFSALLVATVALKGVQSQGCSKLAALMSCFPQFQIYMQRGVNVTMVFKAFTGGADSIDSVCNRFKNMTSCVAGKMRDCDSETDATNMFVQYWKRADEGIKFLCIDNKQFFVSNEACLKKSEVVRGSLTCDTDDHDGARRKRHSCADYEKEVKCTDDLVTKYCNSDVAKKTGKLTRLFLKNTPHTKDCTEPAWTSGVSPLLCTSSSALMALVAVLCAWFL
jgi:hypothetical protein